MIPAKFPLLCLICVTHTQSQLQTRGSFFSRVEDSPHGPLTGSALTRYDQMRGSLECGLLCLRTDGCLWFTYQPGMESCSPQNDLIVPVEGGRQNSSLLPTYTFLKNTACLQHPGYVYDPETDFCFRAFNESKTWNGANRTCVDQRAHLVTIDNGAKTAAIEKYLASFASSSGYWIGVVDGGNVWTTWDSKPLDYQNWASGEPNTPSQKCVCIWKFMKWKWDDNYCTGVFLSFICQKDV